MIEVNPVPKIQIGELNSSKDDYYIVDVRSEKEYAEDHIPDSVNMPVLDDEQRHMIGYTYKQIDPKKAIELGYSILDKKIDDYVKKLGKVNKKIVIMCFRGGMRSCAVTEFLINKGVPATQLEGGYKAYRQEVKDSLEQFDYSKKNIFVLYGLTGTNKTHIINGIDFAIDLEGFANHRGSLFGGVGLEPSTQKMFDTLLLDALNACEKNILLEGESKKIGDVFIPKNLFKEMENAKLIQVKMSIEKRVKNILEDYFDTQEKIQEIREIVPKLKERLGKKRIQELLDLLDSKRYSAFVKILLEEYYDPLYRNTVDAKEYAFVVETDDTDEAIMKIDKFIKGF